MRSGRVPLDQLACDSAFVYARPPSPAVRSQTAHSEAIRWFQLARGFWIRPETSFVDIKEADPAAGPLGNFFVRNNKSDVRCNFQKPAASAKRPLVPSI